MQIYGPSQLHGAHSIQAPHAARPADVAQQAETMQPASDRLDISEAGRIASQMAEIPDIRWDRVESIRTALADGTYETGDKLDTALDRLLDEIA